jgi:hypothetical protein
LSSSEVGKERGVIIPLCLFVTRAFFIGADEGLLLFSIRKADLVLSVK